MAVTINPDKYIRLAIHALVNNIVVSTKQIKCFDSRATNATSEYILLTAQTKEIEKVNKCAYRWESTILIEIYTKVSSAGNTGSRVLLNDIEQAVYTLLSPTLSVQNFQTLTQNISFENQLETITETDIIMRSFLRLTLTLI